MFDIDNDVMPENKSLDTMGEIKKYVYTTLNALNDGEKITLKDLIDKTVAVTGTPISIANGVMSMIVHGWCNEGNGSINRGAYGGIFKGGKKVRVDPRPRCEACNQVVRPKITKE